MEGAPYRLANSFRQSPVRWLVVRRALSNSKSSTPRPKVGARWVDEDEWAANFSRISRTMVSRFAEDAGEIAPSAPQPPAKLVAA